MAIRNIIGGQHVLTQDHFALSLVRKQDTNHAYLILEGVNQEGEYESTMDAESLVIKEIHFFLDGQKPTYFFPNVGWGLIQIRDKPLSDLQKQVSQLVAKTWQITKEEAEQLLANVEADQNKKIGYIRNGRGINSYNSLTWCEMQLERMGLNLNLQPHWYDFILVIPIEHLPEAHQAEPTTKGSCLVM